MGALLRAIRRRPLKHAAAHVYYIGHLLALAGYSLDCSNDEIKWNARAFGSVNDEPLVVSFQHFPAAAALALYAPLGRQSDAKPHGNPRCVSLKRIPDIFNCNSSVHRWILIIFGRTWAIEDAIGPNFPPHLISASALPCKTGNTEIRPFHLNVVCCCANKHIKHIIIITRS